MSDITATGGRPTSQTRNHGLLDRIARNAVLGRLAGLQHGLITLIDGEEHWRLGKSGRADALHATITVRDPGFWADAAFAGTIGAGEAYMAGAWECDDLTALIRILTLNREVLDGLEVGLARLSAPLFKLAHAWRRNTRAGSRRNISAHYDLGNELFELFLDPTMMYSCAFFEQADSTLERAAVAKIERLCAKLELNAADHLLEIGSGWGGFAIHAAHHHGCRVTTTTISQRQYELAIKRVHDAGLDDRVTVLLTDYRELKGTYDKLVSIEMVEAVGHQFYDTYFGACSRLLTDNGLMALQAITIADQRYAAACRSVDFIQRHVFPGSCIPSLTAMATSLTRATDLRMIDLEDLTPHYVRTLRLWRQRFRAHLPQIRALGYDERFVRMWEFYLSYCEGGFAERAIGTVQLVLGKPAYRQPEELSLNRSGLASASA